MKKMLILGAGIYQVPLIRKAKELGLDTIVASIPGDYPGFSLADEVCYLDTTDEAGILELARSKQIDGICTCGTDVAMLTVGAVCDAMGLRGVSRAAAEQATNKILMKQCFQAHGVRTADFRVMGLDATLQQLKQCCEELTYPVIFKATDSSGSRGIVKVYAPDGIAQAVEKVRAVTRRHQYLIEKVLVGEEFGVQAFVQNGTIEFVLPTDTVAFQGDTGVPAGHSAPYGDALLEEKVKQQTERAIRALGLDNCAVNADCIVQDGEPYFFEMGARCGATCLAELISIYYGFDHYEKILRVALGETVSFQPCNTTRVPNASALIRANQTGRLTQFENRNTVGGDLVEIVLDCKVGDSVRKFHVGTDRIGHIIAKGSTLQQAFSVLEEALAKIVIAVEEEV